MTDHTPTPEPTGALCGAYLNRSSVEGHCPACGWEALFLGDGGYITCGRLDCPAPDAASTLLEQDPLRTAEVPVTNPCRATYETPTARTIRRATEEAESAVACERETFADLTRERAEHEEHRRQLADALGGLGPDTPWERLIRRAAQVLAGRHRAVDMAQEIEADRDRLAEQLRRAAGRLADAGARAEQAEELLSIAHQTSNTSERLRALAATERDQLAAELRNARYETEGERRRADRAEATVRDYENRITWETTCGEHARLLDACRVAGEHTERAEATIARVRDIGRRLAAQAVAFQDVLDDSDRGPWARMIRAELAALAAALDGEQPDAGPEPESEAAMSFTDAVETATEEEVSGPDPDESEEPCFHPSWETEPTVGARKCTDCGEWLDPQPPEPVPEPGDAELTADEARAEVDRLATDLYQAQDALAFVAEMCNIADREGTPVTTARVRDWLKGAQCARQAGLVVTHGPVVDAVRQALARR